MESLWQEPFNIWPIKIESQRKCYTPDPDLRENMSQGNCHLFHGRDHNNAAHWPKDKLASGIVKEEKHQQIILIFWWDRGYINHGYKHHDYKHHGYMQHGYKLHGYKHHGYKRHGYM